MESPDNTSRRPFTTDGYKNISGLMEKIGGGDAKAANDFVKFIQPFMDKTARQSAEKVFAESGVNDEAVKEAVNTVLAKVFEDPQNPHYFMGNKRSWSNFQVDVKNELNSEFEREKKRMAGEAEVKSSLSALAVKGHDNDPLSLPRPEIGSDPQNILATKQGTTALRKVVRKTLTDRYADVLDKRFVDGDTIEEVGAELGISKARVNDIERRILRNLKKELTNGKTSSWER